MFERFTDKARRVIVVAQEEARAHNSQHIDVEHLLLGIMSCPESVATKAIESLDVSIDVLNERLGESIGQGQQHITGHIPFTPRAKKVLELSLREALQLGHNYIGTEHILLGLIREGKSGAVDILESLGAGSLTKVRQSVIQLLSPRPKSEYVGRHRASTKVDWDSWNG